VNALVWTSDRLGMLDVEQDEAYVMDEFGTLVWVPFSLPSWYFQEH
jgi:hypothetical protein